MAGEAMDSGDKGCNKAESAAYKYACFQAFCIPVEGDVDADSESHSVKQSSAVISQDQLVTILNLLSQANISEVVVAESYSVGKLDQLPVEKFNEVRDRLLARIAEIDKKKAGDNKSEAPTAQQKEQPSRMVNLVEVELLKGLAKNAQVPETIITGYYTVASLNDLTLDRYEETITRLQARIASNEAAEQNKQPAKVEKLRGTKK